MDAEKSFKLPPRLPKGWIIAPVENVPVGAEVYTFDCFIRGRWILGSICPHHLDCSYLFPCPLTEDHGNSFLIEHGVLVAYNANAPLMPLRNEK